MIHIEKQAFELVEFEEIVKTEGGFWLRLLKLPPPEEEIDPKAAKKAQPKGKVPLDELKPTIGMAWVPLADL